jgi:uncharacterized membrane protein
MRQFALPAAIGLVLGGLVHLTTVLAMPRLALEDAYARLERLGPVNKVHMLPNPTPFAATLPRMDPAFVAAVCLYDLRRGPLRVRVPLSADYTSVSFYTRHGLPYYAINDRAAGRRNIDLMLMTSSQRAALPEDEEITAADRLIVESPSFEGVVLIRALARELGVQESISARVAESSCAQGN